MGGLWLSRSSCCCSRMFFLTCHLYGWCPSTFSGFMTGSCYFHFGYWAKLQGQYTPSLKWWMHCRSVAYYAFWTQNILHCSADFNVRYCCSQTMWFESTPVTHAHVECYSFWLCKKSSSTSYQSKLYLSVHCPTTHVVPSVKKQGFSES